MTDLVLTDFRAEPAEMFVQGSAQNGQLVGIDRELPTVFHIDLVQVVRHCDEDNDAEEDGEDDEEDDEDDDDDEHQDDDHRRSRERRDDKDDSEDDVGDSPQRRLTRVEGASVRVTVSGANEVLGIESTYRPERIRCEGIGTGKAGAIRAALAAVGWRAEDLAEPALAVPQWVPSEGTLRRTWAVALKPASQEQMPRLVEIRAADSAILSIEDLGSYGCALSPPDLIPDGYRDGVASVITRKVPRGALQPTPAEILDSFEDVPLLDMCKWAGKISPAFNGVLKGKYVRVLDGQTPPYDLHEFEGLHQAPDYDFRLENPLRSLLKFDPNLDGSARGTLDAIHIDTLDGDPTVSVSLGQSDEEDDLDEVMAYYHADHMARFFSTRYGRELDRAANAGPSLAVIVDTQTPLGPDNSYWLLWPNLDASAASGTAFKFDVYVLMGRGSYFQPMGDNVFFGGPAPNFNVWDLYGRLDWTRDPTAIAHEFSHVMIWDVSDLRGGRIDRVEGGAGDRWKEFHEGMADYFAGTAYDRPRVLEWVTTPQVGRDLSPPDGGQVIVPYGLTGEAHDDGRAIAQSFWMLRNRFDQVSREFPGLSYGPQTADRLAWGAVNRVGKKIESFEEVLVDSLATDSDAFDRLFHYEVKAAFAAHGISLERDSRVIVPWGKFVVDGRATTAPAMAARAFIGDNQSYIAEFTTNPDAFGLGDVFGLAPNPLQRPDRNKPGFNYIRITSGEPGAFPVVPLPGAPADGHDRVVDFEISNADLELLTGDKDFVVVLMRIYAFSGPATQPFQGGTSHEPGAGALFTRAEDPGVLYISSSTPVGSCTCSFAGQPAGTAEHAWNLLSFALAVVVAYSLRWRH